MFHSCYIRQHCVKVQSPLDPRGAGTLCRSTKWHNVSSPRSLSLLRASPPPCPGCATSSRIAVRKQQEKVQLLSSTPANFSSQQRLRTSKVRIASCSCFFFFLCPSYSLSVLSSRKMRCFHFMLSHACSRGLGGSAGGGRMKKKGLPGYVLLFLK